MNTRRRSMGLLSFHKVAETDPTAFWLSLALLVVYGIGMLGVWNGYLVPASLLIWGCLRGFLYYLENVSVRTAPLSALEFWVWISQGSVRRRRPPAMWHFVSRYQSSLCSYALCVTVLDTQETCEKGIACL